MTADDIPFVHRELRQAYAEGRAPIVDLMAIKTGDPFRTLVAALLSSRTRDETTAAVCARLFRVVRSPADLRTHSIRAIEKLIHPIGFYRTKARHLRALPDVLDRAFGGTIPQTVAELCRLPGVGRKTANLVVATAFDKPAICVDVHVHRIGNRLGLVATRTPFETEMALRRTLPVRYWITWNTYLVAYGQTVCTPRRPACATCRIARVCGRVGLPPITPIPPARPGRRRGAPRPLPPHPGGKVPRRS